MEETGERSSAECSSTGSAWPKNVERQNKWKVVQQTHNCEVIISQLIILSVGKYYKWLLVLSSLGRIRGEGDPKNIKLIIIFSHSPKWTPSHAINFPPFWSTITFEGKGNPYAIFFATCKCPFLKFFRTDLKINNNLYPTLSFSISPRWKSIKVSYQPLFTTGTSTMNSSSSPPISAEGSMETTCSEETSSKK